MQIDLYTKYYKKTIQTYYIFFSSIIIELLVIDKLNLNNLFSINRNSLEIFNIAVLGLFIFSLTKQKIFYLYLKHKKNIKAKFNIKKNPQLSFKIIIFFVILGLFSSLSSEQNLLSFLKSALTLIITLVGPITIFLLKSHKINKENALYLDCYFNIAPFFIYRFYMLSVFILASSDLVTLEYYQIHIVISLIIFIILKPSKDNFYIISKYYS